MVLGDLAPLFGDLVLVTVGLVLLLFTVGVIRLGLIVGQLVAGVVCLVVRVGRLGPLLGGAGRVRRVVQCVLVVCN